MNRRRYLPGNLEGSDMCIETSLKEYGMAWNTTDNDTSILFYYGVGHDGDEYTAFDFGTLPKYMDIFREYDWVDFKAVEDSIGCRLEDMPLEMQLRELANYYSLEEVFGSCYWEGLTYQQILMNW